MKKIIVLLLAVMMAAGFNWSLPQKTASTVPATAQASKTSYMASISWLNYQGQKAQARAQSASITKVERQRSSAEATYAFSGQGGFQVGKDEPAILWGGSPLTVRRNLADDRLSSDVKGLGLWLTVVNNTLGGLAHREVASGTWEESIDLGLDDSFPRTIKARFQARPLPEPDSQWVLVTADSGLLSFRALGEKTLDPKIYGRYQGVLVYSPEEDAFLQSAAAFIVYHGEDQYRIEQMQFASDADGKQLYPVLDVSAYLKFDSQAPAIAKEGPFPSWCVQATQVLDIVNLAMMTAAEGATNPESVLATAASTTNQQVWNQQLLESIRATNGVNDLIELGNKVNKRISAWLKALDFANKAREEGMTKALVDTAEDIGKSMTFEIASKLVIAFVPQARFLKIFLDYAVPLAVMAYQIKKTYDLQKTLAEIEPSTGPVTKPRPRIIMDTPETRAQEAPPPVRVKKRVAILPIVLGVAALTAGLLVLKKKGGGKIDCNYWWNTAKCIGPDWANPDATFSTPKTCGCPNGTTPTGGTSIRDGIDMIWCKGCPKI